MEHPTSTPEDQSRALSGVISDALRDAGISLRTASASSGIPLTTLSRRLTGTSPLTVIELAALATLLGTSTTELTGRVSGRSAA